MKNPPPSILGWIFTSLFLLFVAGACLFQWRSERLLLQEAFTKLATSVKRVERKCEVAALNWTAVSSAFERGQAELPPRVETIESPHASLQATNDKPSGRDSSASEPPDGDQTTIALPSLPEGVNASAIARIGLNEALKETRINPEGRVLDRIQAARAQARLANDRAKIDILDSDIKLRLVEGMEKLRLQGGFVEYAKNEEYETVPGVMTAGEEMENGGVRLFYFYPEEFKELFAKRKEKKEVEETYVRKLMAFLGQ